jgi:hypothetical protein
LAGCTVGGASAPTDSVRSRCISRLRSSRLKPYRELAAGWPGARWEGFQSRRPPRKARFRTPFVAANAAPPLAATASPPRTACG